MTTEAHWSIINQQLVTIWQPGSLTLDVRPLPLVFISLEGVLGLRSIENKMWLVAFTVSIIYICIYQSTSGKKSAKIE